MTANKLISGGCMALVAIVVILAAGAWYVHNQAETALFIFTTMLRAVLVTLIISCVLWILAFLGAGLRRVLFDRAMIRQAMAEARRAELEARYGVVTASGTDQVFITRDGEMWRAAHRDPRVQANGQWSEPQVIEAASYLAWLEAIRPRINQSVTEQLLNPSPADLLAALDNIDRSLIVGSSGAGKTTLLQHIITRRRGHVVVIDPHDDTKTWPPGTQVVGAGQDYGGIERALIGLTEQVRERYELRATGAELTGDNCPPLTVIIDEWREITGAVKGAGDHMKTILTGGRKVYTACFVGTHSERARPLGIEGEADLKDGFAIVRLQGSRAAGFSATLDAGNGEIPVSLPGPYRPGVLAAPPRAGQLLPDLAATPLLLDETERRILAAWDAGEHRITRIGALVYGQKGGMQNKLVAEVLTKHGRI